MATEDFMLSESELDQKGDILVKAEEIKSNSEVYRAVTNHMKKRAAKINRIADLRAKLSENLETGHSNQKEMVEL